MKDNTELLYSNLSETAVVGGTSVTLNGTDTKPGEQPVTVQIVVTPWPITTFALTQVVV